MGLERKILRFNLFTNKICEHQFVFFKIEISITFIRRGQNIIIFTNRIKIIDQNLFAINIFGGIRLPKNVQKSFF